HTDTGGPHLLPLTTPFTTCLGVTPRPRLDHPKTPQRHHRMDTPTTVNAGGGKAADPVLLD
ncbi:hypothetical protein D2E98_23505, partial [Mycobacteroides abscessus]